MKNHVYISKGLLQLIKNCLERDVAEGKKIRQEILDEINNTVVDTEDYQVVVTRNHEGEILAVTRQDREGQILKVIAESV